MTTVPHPEKVPFGMIVLPGKVSSAFPLERTRVTGQITGSIASILVEQHFRNGLEQAAEIEYLFPLPEKAAVFGFELRIGGRTVRGEVQENQQARERYDFARDRGQQAALVEQRRPNLFTVRVANILPGKPIVAALRYTEPLQYQDGEWEFVFPMGLTPRYNAPGHEREAAGTAHPVAEPGEAIGPVEITLSLQCSPTCDTPTSPSHPLDVARLDEGRYQVRLAQSAIPDHDLVLRYRAALDAPMLSAYAHQAAQGAHFLVNLLPPRIDAAAVAPSPRDFIFVLDRSGSMMGEPIAQARNALRACLRALNPGDTFRILLFDNEMEWFQPEPSTVTQAQIEAADDYLAQVEGRGGTDIIGALYTTLNLPAGPAGRTRYVVFLTDGAVSAEDRALEHVRRQIGAARLFTFGIGPSVNRALLRRMAALGRGTAEFLQLDEDIEGAIIRFQDRISFPALQNIQVEWRGARVWDTYPTQLPDLYYGQPLEMTGRMAAGEGSQPVLILSGSMDGQPLRLEQPLTFVNEPAIGRAWARARIDELVEKQLAGDISPEQARDEILSLALRHQLLSSHTAFVAVDDEVVAAGGQPVVIAVAQPLPQGLNMAGFTGAVLPAPAARMMRMASFMPASTDAMALNKMSTQTSPRAGRALKESADAQPAAMTTDALLRELARTQNVNGSWQDDIELTLAAVLAFVRNGHTTHAGSYRQQLRKAYVWLAKAQIDPDDDDYLDIRVLVLTELAEKTGSDEQAQVAKKLDTTLKRSDRWGMSPPPQIAKDMDTLRIAVILNSHITPAPSLLKGKHGFLARVWAASLPKH